MTRNKMLKETERLKTLLGLEMAKVKHLHRMMELTEEKNQFYEYYRMISESIKEIHVLNDAIVGNLADLKNTKWEPGEPTQEDLEEWQEIE